MLSQEKQDEIYNNIVSCWEARYPGIKLDPDKLDGIKQLLTLFPHQDGMQR